jgi:L-asparaginase
MKLSQIGVIGGSDITTESAIAKMMFLLGQGYNNSEMKKLLQVPLRGELTL